MPDIYGSRGKIGIAIPAVNTVVETECAPLMPPGVTNHVARLHVVERPLNTEQAFMEHVELMRAGIVSALDMVSLAAPSHMIMAVALEAFWGGLDTATKLQERLEAHTKLGVSMGGSATVAALKRFGAKKISILTPHAPKGDAMVRKYFEDAGYDIVKLIGLSRGTPQQIATTTTEEIRGALHALALPEVEAIVQVGTNLPMKDMAVAAERWLGKPVLCINVVTYWDALRRMGIDDRLYGHGWILERF